MVEIVLILLLLLLVVVLVICRDECDGHRDSDVMKNLNFACEFEYKMMYKCYLNKL